MSTGLGEIAPPIYLVSSKLKWLEQKRGAQSLPSWRSLSQVDGKSTPALLATRNI